MTRIPKTIMCTIFGFTAFFLFFQSTNAGNKKIKSFYEAKKNLEKITFKKTGYSQIENKTIYCGCSFDSNKNVDFSSCGYKPKSMYKRAAKVEWEHVVPAHAFGKSFKEWFEGHPKCKNRNGKPFKGRKCCQKSNVEFCLMEADMYNLYPAIGEINALRSNYSMAMIPGEKRDFGACDVEIEGRKVEPRPEVRGDIARTYMYMDMEYPGRGIISGKNKKLFEAWSKADPVDASECRRASLIEKIQGNRNEIVMKACENAGL